MRRTKTTSYLLLITLLMSASIPTIVASADPPKAETPESLALVQLKITGDEYIVIQNNSLGDIDDLSQYSLRAFNNVNVAATGVSQSTQSLPAVTLSQGERLLLSSAIRATCGASLAGKLSLSLVDSSGTLQILFSLTADKSVIDEVSWSSTNNGHIPSVPSGTKAPLGAYYRYGLGQETFGWQFANHSADDGCSLVVPGVTGAAEQLVSVGSSPSSALTTLSITAEGAVVNDSATNPSIQPGNEMLLSPVITELLPNPAGTGNDTTDEYIEIFNPNDVEFLLSDYVLKAGLTTLRSYAFREDDKLAPKSYAIFYAPVTKLSLSNAVGRVQLFGSKDKVVTSTEIYRAAKDGQAWVLIDEVWQWSLHSTPGKENILVMPPEVIKKAAVTQIPTKKTTKVAAIKTSKAPKAVKITTTPTAASISARPVQTRAVAIVALIALLYGAYEYRRDLANKYYQCRRNLGARCHAWRSACRR